MTYLLILSVLALIVFIAFVRLRIVFLSIRKSVAVVPCKPLRTLNDFRYFLIHIYGFRGESFDFVEDCSYGMLTIVFRRERFRFLVLSKSMRADIDRLRPISVCVRVKFS